MPTVSANLRPQDRPKCPKCKTKNLPLKRRLPDGKIRLSGTCNDCRIPAPPATNDKK